MIVLKIIGWVLLGILALVIVALCVKVRIACEYSEENTFVALQWLFLKIPLFPRDKKQKGEGETADAPADGEEPPAEEAEAPAESVVQMTEPAGEELPDEDELPEEDGEVSEQPEESTGKNDGKKKKDKPKESLLHIIYRTNGIDGILLLLKRLFSYLGTFIGDLLNSVIVETFSFDVRCSKGDAAETAIYYGEVCSAVFPLLGSLVSKYRVKDYDINIYPDYLARFSSASFALCFFVRPIRLIGITLVFGCRLIFKVALRMFVKIFLSLKNGSTEKQNKKNSEKRDDPK